MSSTRIGSTLLGNWVEERSVSELIKSEQNFRELSRVGHKQLLAFDVNENKKEKYISTQHLDYAGKKTRDSRKGPRQQSLEKRLLEKATESCTIVISPEYESKDWKSVTKQDHFDIVHVEERSEDFSQINDDPITFWTHSLHHNNSVYATNFNQELSFHRSSKFSCPIDEYKKGSEKNE